ncbi:MAG: hypothetical protein WDM90_22610 [Ferruginibacter sp.]
MKIIAFLINAIYWLGIFISPVLIFSFVVLWLYSNNTTSLSLSILIGILGLILGILFAEYVRRKYGLNNFFGGTSPAADIDKENDKK